MECGMPPSGSRRVLICLGWRAVAETGVQTLAGTVWLGAMLGLEHLGLEAKRDNITFLVIGDQTVATQALEGGQNRCDGAGWRF